MKEKEILEKIADKYLNIDINDDSKHEVAVRDIAEALEKAYTAGLDVGIEVGLEVGVAARIN